MSAWRIFTLILCFFLEVHVKAESLNATSLKAGGCWGKSIPCAAEALERVVHLEGTSVSFSLDKGAVIEQRTADRIQIVSGTVYADVNQTVEISTPFARFSCASECQALLSRKTDQVTLQSLQGEWVVHRLGDKQKYIVRSGQELRVGEVTPSGKAEMEFPQSVPWLPAVKTWARLFPGTPDAFKMEVSRFRADWNHAVATVSEMHREYAGRTIAAYQKELDVQRTRQKAQEKEDQSLRELFRQKNSINP